MRTPIISSVFFVIIIWVFFTSFYFLSIQNGNNKQGRAASVLDKLEVLEHEVVAQSNISRQLAQQFVQLKSVMASNNGKVDQPSVSPVIGILVISCNRIQIKRCLDLLLKYRPSKEQFPIVVSQDCDHSKTAQVIGSYKDQLTHIKHPDQSDIPLGIKEKKFKGYYKIARHYKWALNQMFDKFNFGSIIIVEDDLDIAPDFYDYFLQTYSILDKDPSLWCVSAWNDNGKQNLVDASKPDLLYRTDFFPGLGWMIQKKMWQELAPKWPVSFWDDWMRIPVQRKERACIRPELSRTKTFGKVGVSKGLFFDKHLKFMKLNEQKVPFADMDLSHLFKDNYDVSFVKIVYDSPSISVEQLKRRHKQLQGPVRITYKTKEEYKKAAKAFGLMDDFKSGVPRAGYRGVVSFMFEGKRVYLAPPANWKGYNTAWS